MKKLYLIRHAKSSWDDLKINDFDRPLNDRGKKDAARMGKRLKEKGLAPDMVVTSPAVRALETCKIICTEIGFDHAKIIEVPKLYHADAEQILEEVSAIKDRVNDDEENMLLFGHNPGLTDFTNRLLNEHILNIPTAGIVCAELVIRKWKNVDWGCGKLLFFDIPKNKLD